MKNRSRCERTIEVKRNCMTSRTCYTKPPENKPDKSPSPTKKAPQHEKYREYMDTVGDRKGLVRKTTNFSKILPVGLLNDFKHSSKILIIPINCEQDQHFLDKPETMDAIKIIRKHFKEIETFAEYTKPFITVMRNPDPNMLQAVPINKRAAESMMNAITDIPIGKGLSKEMNKSLDEVLRSVSKSNPNYRQIEVNEIDINEGQEEIVKQMTKSAAKLSNRAKKVAAFKAAPTVRRAPNPQPKIEPVQTQTETIPELPREAIKETLNKTQALSENTLEPQTESKTKTETQTEAPKEMTLEPKAETIQEVKESSVEESETLESKIKEESENQNIHVKENPETQDQINLMSNVKEEAIEESSKNLIDTSLKEEPLEGNVKGTTRAETVKDVQAMSSEIEEEIRLGESYINPYPESIQTIQSDLESKPSITSITFDFETNLMAREQMESKPSEQMQNVAMIGMVHATEEAEYVPVNFNAVITGSLNVATQKLPNDQVTNMEPDELNKLIENILTNLGKNPTDTVIGENNVQLYFNNEGEVAYQKETEEKLSKESEETEGLREVTVNYPNEVPTTFMVVPQVREDYPYSDGKHLMGVEVYKRAVEETRKIKEMLGDSYAVEMKSGNDPCKVCTEKGTTCNAKKSGSSCNGKSSAPKKSASSSSCKGGSSGGNGSKSSGQRVRSKSCGGEEKPKKPKCKKPDDKKVKKGCQGTPPKGSSSCGKMPKPNKPCPPPKPKECQKEECKKEECPKSNKCDSKASSCGQQPPKSKCESSKKSKCLEKKEDKPKCPEKKKESKPKKTVTCGQDKPKTTPNCGKDKNKSKSASGSGKDKCKSRSSSSSSSKSSNDKCKGRKYLTYANFILLTFFSSKVDKLDTSNLKLLCPVTSFVEKYKFLNQLTVPSMNQARWFRGSIIRRRTTDEDVIANQKLCIVGRKILNINEEDILLNSIDSCGELKRMVFLIYIKINLLSNRSGSLCGLGGINWIGFISL